MQYTRTETHVDFEANFQSLLSDLS